MKTQMLRNTLVVVGFFVGSGLASGESPAPSTRGVTGRIDAAIATETFSGGGVDLTTEDLRRIASNGVDSPNGGDGARGGGGGF
ncbi:MAG: hypothetical protein H6819_08195 [Phycisphaerales bacterium]|nr:hypothetical protein [Phycisphaerales bacterium]MCB9854244.1 hypothetical protein [Phycisphaerales bacterium]MCB9864748.1 hypothetical protein [Phycisphaerales bacterium]